MEADEVLVMVEAIVESIFSLVMMLKEMDMALEEMRVVVAVRLMASAHDENMLNDDDDDDVDSYV